jgi:hypothetical protein
MEHIPLMLNEANRLFQNSDHLAYMTYPLVQDERLLIRIAENLNDALNKFVELVLYYDRLYKKIGPYPSDFKSKFEIFRTKCAERYGFDKEQIKIIKELNTLFEEKKKSNIQFIRNNKYFIANGDYRMKSIDITQLKSYINNSKDFVQKVNLIVRR